MSAFTFAARQNAKINRARNNAVSPPGKCETRYETIMIVIWHFKELLKHLTGEVILRKVSNAVSSTETIPRVGDRRKHVSTCSGVFAIKRVKTVNFKIIAILH